METNGFRIGNIMQDSLTGELLRVSELTETNVVTTVIDRSKYPLPDGWEMEPVPLTPEVLEKCGFEPCSCGGWKGPLHLESDFSIQASAPIKYLHQLQNFHFAYLLTELIYTP